MGEVATTETAPVQQPATDTTPQAPVQGTQEPAQGAAAGGSTQGGTPTPEGAQTAPQTPAIEPEPHVPWGRFREVQTEHTKLKRQLAEFETKAQAQERAWQEQLQAAKQFETNYTALERALKANPDLAQALYERLGPGNGQPQQPPVAQLPPDIVKRLSILDKIEQRFSQQEQYLAQQAEKQETQRIETEFTSKLTDLLKAKGYDPEAELPYARDHILRRAVALDAELEELPQLFAEWHRAETIRRAKWTTGYVAQKTNDAKLPQSPGQTPPVRVAPKMGANDHSTSETLLRELTGRLGWGENGAS